MQIEITPEYLTSQELSQDFPQRFWVKVKKTESCWIWTGAMTSVGRGGIACGHPFGRKQIGAHQASWILNHGPIPKGLYVLHNCPNGDRGDCVNPDHLWLGTQRQNVNDASKKGRIHHKLTKEQVLHIRALYPGYTTRALAQRFNIGKSTIWCVVTRKSWQHI